MTDPFLSIVTISFNQAKFLRETIESVISQKDDDIEYIIVDPGSTDGSREIIAEYAGRIDHVLLDPDKGPADGLNKGFAKARGRIGYFINSDDYLLPRAIAKMRRAWAARPDADVILQRGWQVDGDGQPTRELVPTSIHARDLRKGTSIVVQPGVSFTLDLFRSVGGFNAENRSCWDYELLAEFARREARFAIFDDRIAAARLYPESITGGGAGAAHEQRADRDFARIQQEILGRAEPADRMTLLKQGRLRRMVFDPAYALHRAREALLPGSIGRRWKSDM